MDDRTAERFQQLIFWATLAAAGTALLFMSVGLLVQNTPALYSAGAVGGYAVLLVYARQRAGHGNLGQASLLVSISLVIVALILAVFQPLLWVNYALVPLLAAAVLLQFAPRIPITPALLACGLTTSLIAAVGELQTPLTMRPDPAIQLLRVISLSLTTGFILFLLWQFRMRLHATLDAVSSTNAQLTVQNTALAEQFEQLTQQMARSEQLVAQVTALETPITTLDEGVLFAPLIGHMSSERSLTLQARLLEAVHTARARWVMIDMQGVPQMDTRVAAELIATFQAVRLLGARVCLCGITGSVASVLTQLGINFEGVTTARSPQEAFVLINGERRLELGLAANLARPVGHVGV